MQIRRQFTNTESTGIRKHFASLAAHSPLFSRACRANRQLHGETTHRVQPEWSRQTPDLLPESLPTIRIIKPPAHIGGPGPWAKAETVKPPDTKQRRQWAETRGRGRNRWQDRVSLNVLGPLQGLLLMLETPIRLRVRIKQKVTYIRYFYHHFKERKLCLKCFHFSSHQMLILPFITVLFWQHSPRQKRPLRAHRSEVNAGWEQRRRTPWRFPDKLRTETS